MIAHRHVMSLFVFRLSFFRLVDSLYHKLAASRCVLESKKPPLHINSQVHAPTEND